MTSDGFVRNNVNQFAFLYRLADLVIIQVALWVATYLYGTKYDFLYFVLALIANLSYSFVSELLWLYRSWRAGALKEMLFYTLLSWTIALLPVLMFVFFAKTAEHYSRVILGVWIISTLCLLSGWRILFRLFLYKMRKEGRNTRSVGIIGLSESGCKLVQEILNHPETGYKLKAIFDDRSRENSSERVNNQFAGMIEGDVNEGVRRAQSGEFEVLFVGLPFSAKNRIEQILRLLGDTTVDVHLIPDFFIYNLLHARIGQVGGLQTVSVYDTPMRGGWSLLKRMEDLILSLIILTVIAIPMLMIAIGVKLSSRGPVIFAQDRYGLDGRKIKVYKFRSMRVTENGESVKQASKNDSRITPFGAFLRRTSLDELPQFINVLQGTMSIVGPRPHAVAHNEEYRKQIEYYMLRHKMKPGITGWAQVNGWRGETDTLDKMKMRIHYDLEYIRHWSLWMDCKIIFATFTKGFVGKNAY
ncbi:MAG: undecaprenyl-phosphate glucose phosphotransferase [Pseudomonadales bacterium]|nr:undecaprenyl-phosphate glucose phosphotransferase [Pseudomonadales bacterium]RLU03376.1 MAG: undecaprenyl-phosphate glucose phosphotransferase [Ketobacter sp.]